jgi:hypothetical protein
MIIALIATWFADKRTRSRGSRGYLVLIFGATSAVATFWFIVMAIAKSLMKHPDRLLCVNNAIQIRQSDGPSLCVVQGVILHYTTVTCTFSWMVQALDLMVRPPTRQNFFFEISFFFSFFNLFLFTNNTMIYHF